MLIGYARVSTLEQDTALQLRELRRAGVRKVYQEKASGAGLGRRAQLLQLLEQLRPGDQVIVYKLDRLARSLRDLLTIAERIEIAGASFRSLTEAFDTSTPAGRMAFAMLGAVAEFERNLIRERAIAGVEVARAAGVRFGRPPKLNDAQKGKLAELAATKRYGLAELARLHAVSVATVKRALAETGLDHLAAAAAPKKAAARRGRKEGSSDGIRRAKSKPAPPAPRASKPSTERAARATPGAAARGSRVAPPSRAGRGSRGERGRQAAARRRGR